MRLNGRGIIERDLHTGAEHDVDAVPPPQDLWAAYVEANGLDGDAAELLAQPFNRNKRTAAGRSAHAALVPDHRRPTNTRGHGAWRGPRPALDGNRNGQDLHCHADCAQTANVAPGRLSRIGTYRVLYLADLDVLLTQPMDKVFSPAFGTDPLRRVKGEPDLNRELYFASYQAMSGGGDEASLSAPTRQAFST